MRAAGGQSGSQPGGSAGSAAEKPQLSYPRHLLGVRQSAPSVVVLAERGERPLWQRWLRRAAKLWNRTLAEQPGGRMLQALHSSIHLAATPQTPARQSWAAQLAAGLAAVGIQLDMQQPAPVDLGELGDASQLAELQAAVAKGGASRLEPYVHNVAGAHHVWAAQGLLGRSAAAAGPRGACAAAHRVALGRRRDRLLAAAPPRGASLPPLPRRH